MIFGRRMNLFQDEFLADAAANFYFADFVADNELEALGIPVELLARLIDDIDPFFERHLKMVPDPGHRHALIQVVGVDADAQQAVHQFDQVLNRIVYTAKENRLIVHGDAGTSNALDSRRGSGGDLPCVIEMGRDKECFLPIEGLDR